MEEPGRTLSGDVARIANLMSEKAVKSRRTGFICVALTLLIGFVVLLTFLYSSQLSSTLKFEEDRQLLDVLNAWGLQASGNATKIIDLLNKLPDSLPKDDPKRVVLIKLAQSYAEVALRADKDRQSNFTVLRDDQGQILSSITSAVVKVGAVLIGIFLIQIMVVFARYFFKIADHISMTSCIIELSAGKIADIKTLAPLLLPSMIDFGREPTSPTEKVVDGVMKTVGELAKKIPTR